MAMEIVNASTDNTPSWLRRAGTVTLSVVLLGLDLTWRSGRIAYTWLVGPTVVLLRLALFGGLCGGAFAAGLSVVQKMAAFAPIGVSWRDVAFVTALAVGATSIFGLAWLILRAVANASLSMTSRIADLVAVTSRPALEQPPMSSTAPAPPKRPKPTSGTGDFVGYTDSGAYLNEAREELLAHGMSVENVAELLKEIGKGAEA